MIEGIDCASPVRDANAVRRAGKRFVCRYLSTPGNPKNLTLSEAKRLREAGLFIVVVFEATAKRALAGHDAGTFDAHAASRQLTDCGLPRMPVYFAVDFDASVRDQAQVDAYLRGAASVLGKQNVGVYGGYYVVKRALNAGVYSYAWQTYAWSGGRWDSRAQLQQYRNGVTVAGIECDLDRATAADYGQWPRPSGGTPGSPTSPTGREDPYWLWLRWRLGEGEFERYGPRSAAVRPASLPRRVPRTWWVRATVFLAARKLGKEQS